MKYPIGLLLLVLSSFHPGFSQQNYIKWENERPLIWKDFKMKVDKSSAFYALSHTGVAYKYNVIYGENVLDIDFVVFAFFEKDLSWYKKDDATDELLVHEQLHFDISELSARMMRKEISEFSFTMKYGEEILNIVNKYTFQREELQKQYDEETNHSRNKEEQKRWEEYVETELGKYSDYSVENIRFSRN